MVRYKYKTMIQNDLDDFQLVREPEVSNGLKHAGETR